MEKSTKTTEASPLDLQVAEVLLDIEKRQLANEAPRVSDYEHLPPEVYREVEILFAGLDLAQGFRRRLGASSNAPPTDSTADQLREAIRDLPPKALRVIFERDIQRRTWDEIASSLGEPKDSLRAIHSKAVSDLIERLGIVH